MFLLFLAQDNTIHVNTRLVQVDVVVRDKNGPVTDLTKDDFTVLDNGKAQRIDVFSVFTAHGANAQPAAPPLKPGTISNRRDSQTETPASATVILFDMLNTALQYQTDAMKQLLRYLKSLDKEDRVALYILENDLHVVQDFTSDPDTLIRAAADIKLGEVAGSELRTVRELVRALAVGRGNRSTFRAAVAMSNISRAQRTDPTADAIEAIARHLAGLPGRKSLVWMSANIPLTPVTGTSRDGKESQIDRAARMLNEANVAIYPVDIRGLVAPDPPAGRGRRGAALESYLPPDAMVRLADATGGRAAFFNNDLEGAVRSAVDDGQVSYTLGFYLADGAFDEKFHKLTVKTVRKGADISHRAGYYANKDPNPSNQERRSILEDLLNSPLDAMQIGLSARAVPDPQKPGTFNVDVTIDTSDVHMEHRDDRWIAQLDLAVRTESSTDASLKMQSLPISLTEERFKTAMQRGMVFAQVATANGPNDRLRIVIQDPSTGHTGSIWIPLTEK